MHEELGDVIQRRKCIRDGLQCIGVLTLAVFVGGGSMLGRQEYLEHNGDVAAAEKHVAERFSEKPYESVLFYVTWPGRQLSYWAMK